MKKVFMSFAMLTALCVSGQVLAQDVKDSKDASKTCVQQKNRPDSCCAKPQGKPVMKVDGTTSATAGDPAKRPDCCKAGSEKSTCNTAECKECKCDESKPCGGNCKTGAKSDNKD